MAQVVLHIGTHKTATTTVQDTFAANAELLGRHGIRYPAMGIATGHHGLVCDWSELAPVYRLPEGSREAFRRLAREYADSDGTLFLSSEEFSRCGEGRVDLGEIRELLTPFEKIRVVCVLREQWQFLQSVYLELAKKQPPPPPPQMVRTSIDTGSAGGLFIDYNLLLDRLEQTFDPGEIALFDYQAAREAPGGILGTVLNFLGSDLGAEDLTPVNEGRSNVSPMPLASWAASTLAQPKAAPPWLVNRCAELLKAVFGDDVSTCVFSRQEFTMLRDRFDPLNRKLAERRADVQPGFCMSSTSPAQGTKFRGEVDARFWSRMARNLVQERV